MKQLSGHHPNSGPNSSHFLEPYFACFCILSGACIAATLIIILMIWVNVSQSLIQKQNSDLPKLKNISGAMSVGNLQGARHPARMIYDVSSCDYRCASDQTDYPVYARDLSVQSVAPDERSLAVSYCGLYSLDYPERIGNNTVILSLGEKALGFDNLRDL